MKLPSPYKCDYCETQKGESNHWHLLWVGVSRADTRDAFHLVPWDDQKAATGDHEHICSESCASKALSKWMATQKATA